MPIKKIKRVFKKITKPIAKVLDKVIPNEIKPALPYLAAVAPFMLPPGFGSGFASGLLKTQAAQQMAARALVSGAANLGSQLAQEGSEGDFSGISTLLAAGTGALSAPGAGDALSGMTTRGAELAGGATGQQLQQSLANRSLLTKAKDFGLTSLAKGADFLSVDPYSGGVGDILRPGGTEVGLNIATAQAASVPLTQGTTDLAMATARKALKDYEDELAEYERVTGEAQTASDDARRTAIRAAMIAGNHSEDVITETLALLGLKDGGRVGLREGGVLAQILPQAQPFAMQLPTIESFQQAQAVFPRLNQIEQGINRAEEDLGNIRERLGNELRQVVGLQGQVGLQQAPVLNQPTNMLSISEMQSTLRGGGDLQGMKDGGIMDLGGKEMDLRGGGFVPIGKKERADDVPARLSKNEFVMTADAVRGAGGGNINEGARRMYETMNRLEARA